MPSWPWNKIHWNVLSSPKVSTYQYHHVKLFIMPLVSKTKITFTFVPKMDGAGWLTQHWWLHTLTLSTLLTTCCICFIKINKPTVLWTPKTFDSERKNCIDQKWFCHRNGYETYQSIFNFILSPSPPTPHWLNFLPVLYAICLSSPKLHTLHGTFQYTVWHKHPAGTTLKQPKYAQHRA